MNNVKKILIESDAFRKLTHQAKELKAGQSLFLHGVAGSLLAFIAACLFVDHRHVLLVASDDDKAEKLRDDCALLLGEEVVGFFAARIAQEGHATDMTAPVSQIETLKALSAGTKLVTVGSPQ